MEHPRCGGPCGKGDTAVTLAALSGAYKPVSPPSQNLSACRVDHVSQVAYGHQFDPCEAPPYRGVVVLEPGHLPTSPGGWGDFRRMHMTLQDRHELPVAVVRPRPKWKPREQAHLSAEQPPPCQEAWFPTPHAYPRRPRHSRAAPPQGPRQAVCLIPLLARGHRMRSGEDFRAAIRRGAKGVQPSLVAHVLPGTGGSTSIGFVVTKAVGSAVDRNRVKRRLRHLMRERLHLLPAGSRVVVRALPASRETATARLAEQLDAALAKAGFPLSSVRA